MTRESPVEFMSCQNLPIRQIASQTDLQAFLKSDTCTNFKNFIQRVGDNCIGYSCVDVFNTDWDQYAAEGFRWALDLLTKMHDEIGKYPAVSKDGRFGNPAFRSWLDSMRAMVLTAHVDHFHAANSLLLVGNTSSEPSYTVGIEERTALAEQVSSYLLNSLGNYQRIDYGTGHEAHFVAWLYCMDAVGVFSLSESFSSASASETAVNTNGNGDGSVNRTKEIQGIKDRLMALVIFPAYMKMMRRLQRTYWLEPAGSHGVWGLDDYHFMPFLWGAAQLVSHAHLKPSSIREDDRSKDQSTSVVDDAANERVAHFAPHYLYFAAIHAINLAKGRDISLRWHSPMLDDISAVPTWAKVYQGLMKMYQVEVLGKLPVMQHFLFGSLLSFQGSATSSMAGDLNLNSNSSMAPHERVHRGDCCGNPLPSIHAAGSQKRDSSCRHSSLSTMPFD